MLYEYRPIFSTTSHHSASLMQTVLNIYFFVFVFSDKCTESMEWMMFHTTSYL